MNRKGLIYHWLGYVALIVFALYWVSIFILAMPNNPAKSNIITHAPRFKNMFGYSWKLFTPPAIYNPRLYIVVCNPATPGHADSTEILLPIVKKKQTHAPFNNKENIIDYLVNTCVTSFIYIIWHDKSIPINNNASDSLTRNAVIGSVANQGIFKVYLSTLNNYCSQVIKEKKIYQRGAKARFVITEKLIRPFNEIGKEYTEKELLVYETDFSPIVP